MKMKFNGNPRNLKRIIKRKFTVVLGVLLMTTPLGCSHTDGDDIEIDGIPAVTVTFKEVTTTPQPAPSDLDGLLPLIEAVVRTMAENGGFFIPEEGEFFWGVAGYLLTRGNTQLGGTAQAEEGVISAIASVLLPDEFALPELAADFYYDESERRYLYTLPERKNEGSVVISDVLEDGGGTLTAYVDLNTDDIITARYILTLVKNDHPDTELPFDLSYIVKAAVVME